MIYTSEHLIMHKERAYGSMYIGEIPYYESAKSTQPNILGVD
jgi:hypothetical protein